MRSAKTQLEALDFPAEESAYSFADPRTELKHAVSERLAAHRSRRGRNADANLVVIAEPSVTARAKPARARSTRIAAAVAERYAHTPSYRDFLAAEAQRAIDEANATAEIAARNAEAVTAVQQQLLAELDLWDEPVAGAPLLDDFAQPSAHQGAPASTEGARYRERVADVVHSVAPGLTVRLYEDIGLRQSEIRADTSRREGAVSEHADAHALNEEHGVLDEEIDFRRAPVFEAASPPTPLPANLIAFPRQLVASRKSRPRLAEGPLRDEMDSVPAPAQLRIFEVEANQISTAASPGGETAVPEWSSIHLDASPVSVCEAAPSSNPADHVAVQLYVPLHTAPLSQRLMSAAVDACILGGAFLAAVCAFAFAVNQIPTGLTAFVAAAATLLVLFVVYHLLFFTFSDATPGMRYARIGLCTFADENPTRPEMRRRTLAILLAASPLGLGLAWALLDQEGLGWHDRLSRMYQRSY